MCYANNLMSLFSTKISGFVHNDNVILSLIRSKAFSTIFLNITNSRGHIFILLHNMFLTTSILTKQNTQTVLYVNSSKTLWQETLRKTLDLQ